MLRSRSLDLSSVLSLIVLADLVLLRPIEIWLLLIVRCFFCTPSVFWFRLLTGELYPYAGRLTSY